MLSSGGAESEATGSLRNSAHRQLSVAASFPLTNVGARHCSCAAPISAHLFFYSSADTHSRVHTHTRALIAAADFHACIQSICIGLFLMLDCFQFSLKESRESLFLPCLQEVKTGEVAFQCV